MPDSPRALSNLVCLFWEDLPRLFHTSPGLNPQQLPDSSRASVVSKSHLPSRPGVQEQFTVSPLTCLLVFTELVGHV